MHRNQTFGLKQFSGIKLKFLLKILSSGVKAIGIFTMNATTQNTWTRYKLKFIFGSFERKMSNKSILVELQTNIDDVKEKLTSEEYISLVRKIQKLALKEDKKTDGFDLSKITIMYPSVDTVPLNNVITNYKCIFKRLVIKALVKINNDLPDDIDSNCILRKDCKLELNWKPGLNKFYNIEKIIGSILSMPNTILSTELNAVPNMSESEREAHEDFDINMSFYPTYCMITNIERL